jgi:hypothetical protein
MKIVLGVDYAGFDPKQDLVRFSSNGSLFTVEAPNPDALGKLTKRRAFGVSAVTTARRARGRYAARRRLR